MIYPCKKGACCDARRAVTRAAEDILSRDCFQFDLHAALEVSMTQTERVLMYMRDFGSVSPVEALRDLGCMRLAARISDLKKKGYVIQRDMVSSSNRYGDEVRYAMYRLVETRL